MPNRWHNPEMFGRRSKRFYLVLAIGYGLITADLVVSLLSGNGSGISALLMIVFGVSCVVCARSARQSALQ